MALPALGTALLTQVSAGGSYFADILPALVPIGGAAPSIAATPVAAQEG